MRPFEEGYKAFRTGDIGNPYLLDSDDWKEFEVGFNRAYFSNLERVKNGTTKEVANSYRGRSKKVY